MAKTALITGVTGQDGSYLAELLLSKDYEVYGLVRRTSTPILHNIGHLLGDLKLLNGDMGDSESLARAIEVSDPDEIYNLAAQSFVGASWTLSESVMDTNANGLNRLLNGAYRHNPHIRVYQASSSEMFGNNGIYMQDETCPLSPVSPYGTSKAAAHHIARNFRDSYGMFVTCGILFNHESPRRGLEFVTRKITRYVAAYKMAKTQGIQLEPLELGNLDAIRDWGFAGDYVEAMWMMMQRDTPSDYVVATGVGHSVRDFVNAAFAHIGEAPHINENPQLKRPTDIARLIGDIAKVECELGWKAKTTFEGLVAMMVDSDAAST